MNITTQVGICNLALIRLGEVGDLTTITSGPDRIDKIIAATYDLEREALLSIFPWNFAQKRAELDYVVATISAATNADPVVLTLNSVSSFTNKDKVYIDHVDGMTELNLDYYMIDNKNTGALTVELYDEDPAEMSDVTGTDTANTHDGIDGTAYGTYTANGQMYLVPKTGYSYAYSLPSDCLAVTALMDEYGQSAEHYEVALDRIYTNLPDAYIEYGYQITDDSTPIMHGAFIDVFAWKLASVWAWPILKDKDVVQIMETKYQQSLAAAMANDARQSMKDYSYTDSFIKAR